MDNLGIVIHNCGSASLNVKAFQFMLIINIPYVMSPLYSRYNTGLYDCLCVNYGYVFLFPWFCLFLEYAEATMCDYENKLDIPRYQCEYFLAIFVSLWVVNTLLLDYFTVNNSLSLSLTFCNCFLFIWQLIQNSVPWCKAYT